LVLILCEYNIGAWKMYNVQYISNLTPKLFNSIHLQGSLT